MRALVGSSRSSAAGSTPLRPASGGGRSGGTEAAQGWRSAAAVDLLDRVTANLVALEDRRADEFRTLRQALAYCWSVVVRPIRG
jgi:hypothetical protein